MQPGLDGCDVLHPEVGDHGIALQPEDVNQIKDSVGGVVELPGHSLRRRGILTELYAAMGSIPVVSHNSDKETKNGLNICY